QWNPIWDGLHNTDGKKKSGKQEEDVMQGLHEEIRRQTQEEKRIARDLAKSNKKKTAFAKAAEGAGDDARAVSLAAGKTEEESDAVAAEAKAASLAGAAAQVKAQLAAVAGAKAALKAKADAGDTPASLAIAAAAKAKVEAEAPGPMPPNYVHKYSLLFAVLGTPAGPGNQHHQLSAALSSGPTAAPAGVG
ncbi:unnamed protein product, partial [Pylaiella littoralis]